MVRLLNVFKESSAMRLNLYVFLGLCMAMVLLGLIR
jgi:hypothetical protein